MQGPLWLVLTLVLLLLVAARHVAAVLPVTQQKEFVDRHNYWRAAVSPTASTAIHLINCADTFWGVARRLARSPFRAGNMEALYWSATLAAAAQAWSDLCVFKHSSSQYGEKYGPTPSALFVRS